MSLDDAFTTGEHWQQGLGELFNDPSLQPQRIELAAGTVIHEAGSAAENVYFILQGQVRLYLPGPAPERTASGRLLDILGTGQWFGYGALSASRSNIARAVAVTRTVVTVVPAERFLNLLATRPAAAVQVVQHLAEAVRAAREDSARLVFDDCNQRLIKTLVRFASSAAARRQDDGETILQITHEQLAKAVGVARETISLALTEFRHQNLVRTGRNQLVFNTGALQEFGQRLRHNGANGSNGNGRHEMAASN
jgi:CRP/FNR family transcriptional regulator